MGIRFLCPNGHKLNVKTFQAGRRGICPFCGARFRIPSETELPVGPSSPAGQKSPAASVPTHSPDSDGSNFEQELEVHVQRAEEAVAADTAGRKAATASAKSAAPVRPATSPSESAPESRAIVAGPLAMNASAADEVRPSEQQPAVGSSAATSLQATPMVDPLAEIPNAVWYVRPPSGGQFGPAQSGMMRNWLSEGRVSSETLVWREGWADWQEAGSVFPELRPTATVPEAPPVAVGDSASSYRTGSRRRKSGPNIGVIVLLAVAVLLLLVVLIVVILNKGTRKNGSGQGSSVVESTRWDGPVSCLQNSLGYPNSALTR